MSASAIALLLAAIGMAPLVVLQQRHTLHLLQLEHYENARMFVWLRRREELVPRPWAPVRVGIGIVAVVLAALGAPIVTIVACAAQVVVGVIPEALAHVRREEIKPLVYTPRARRILTGALVPVAVVLLAGIGASLAGGVAAAIACALVLPRGHVPAAKVP